MKKIKLTGILRGNEFSPNHIGNDSAIFELTVRKLRSKGFSIKICNEAEFRESDNFSGRIFGMARDKRTIAKLKAIEQQDTVCINSGSSIENCFRGNMTNLLQEKGIPFPDSRMADTREDSTKTFKELGGSAFWIKRGDFHAMHKEDVSFCSSIEEGNSLLREFALRGIETAAISIHLTGDLVKFYGVRETDFFYWFYPFDFCHSKFGDEAINGKSKNYPFSKKMLHFVGNQAAEALGVLIYGGDAIISAEGDIHIIDLNDWPSFAPCRETASEAIAQCIYNHLKKQ